MISPTTEVIELIVTQAIERYRDMNPDNVSEVIAKEWPEQMAAILDFFIKTPCGICGAPHDFIEIERDKGDGYYILPICDCEWGEK